MSGKRARVALTVRLRAFDVFVSHARDPKQAPSAYRRWRRRDREDRDRGVRVIACEMREVCVLSGRSVWRWNP